MILILPLLTGFLLVRLIWPNALRLCSHDILRLSLGAGIGLGLASAVTFVTTAVSPGRQAMVIAGDVLLFAAALGAYLLLRRAAGCPFCGRPVAAAAWPIWLAAAVSGILAAIAYYRFTDANPLGEWDAWAIWNHHARFLASGSQWIRMFSPHLIWAVQDYPLLLPGAIANAWIAAGSQSPLVPALVSAMFLFATAGILFGTLDLLRGRVQALTATTTLFGASAIIHMAASQYADVPIAFFYAATAALINLSSGIPGARHALWLAGLSAGFAAWTKNEGLVFLAATLASAAFTREGKRIPAILGGALAPLVLVLWFKTQYAPANYLFTEQQPLANRLTDSSRYITVISEFARQLFTLGGWLLPPVLIAAAYLWLMGRSKEYEFGRTASLLALVLMSVAYAGVYILTTKDVNWQIQTSLSRVLMQLWPMAVLVFFLYAKPPDIVALGENQTPKRMRRKLART